MAICESEKGGASSAILTSSSHLTCASMSCLILASLCYPTRSSSCCPLFLLQPLPVTPTHAPICHRVSLLPHSVPLPLKGSPVILLVSRSLPVAPNYSFLCHTCPAPRLLPYLRPKLLLPSVTLAPFFPWLLSALPCLVPISLILFCPLPVFGLPSSGSAILLCHLIFSFIGLYCSQGVSPFLLPPWMPAEGAGIASLLSARCLLLQLRGCIAPSAETQQH